MRDIFLDYKLPNKPIMILGKGPSLDSYTTDIKRDFYLIGINQVCNSIPVDITFIIHSEHVTDGPLIMPYFPHVGRNVGPLSKVSHAYHYNLNTAPETKNGTPIITTDGFSIHALLNILGLLGVREVSTLGVDGGTKYATLIDAKPRNGYFDMQFPEINRISRKFDMSITPFGSKAGHSEMSLTVNE